MVHRQRAAGQLHAGAGGHQVLDAEPLEVRHVGVDAVVLGAGGELDVLAEQVQHAAELARRVVARGARMAVKVGADPAGRIDRPLERRRRAPRRRPAALRST